MATPNFNFLGQYNGFLPKLTGQVMSFVMEPERFSLNQYVQFVQTPALVGVYQELGRDDFVRVVSVDDDLWDDATPRDKGDRTKITHRMIPFRCIRRQRSAYLGYQAIQQVEGWKPKVAHTKAITMQTMVAMTQRIVTILTTASNWNGATDTATSLNGGAGTWATASADPGSPRYNAIWRTITSVLSRIHLLTNGSVTLEDLRFIVGPTLAIKMSQTPEMVEYCRSSPAAKDILEKGLDPQYTKWGLPRTYKGAQFIVEDAPIVTANQSVDSSGNVLETSVSDPNSTTASRRYIFPSDTCIVASRVGGLEGEASGSPNFSTVQVYYHGERMQVEGHNDSWNRIFTTSVVVNQQEVLASPVSGYRVTGCQ